MNAENALLPITLFASWLASGERGISSNAIVNQLTGHPTDRYPRGDDHPYDPADFRRCEQLLTQVPLARVALPAMAERSEVWARLVDHWDEIRESIESERSTRGDSYALMKRVLAPDQSSLVSRVQAGGHA